VTGQNEDRAIEAEVITLPKIPVTGEDLRVVRFSVSSLKSDVAKLSDIVKSTNDPKASH
jgi:hypothetical protein